MSADRDPLDELLASISDGRALDWDEATRGAPPAARSRVEALRDVSRIAEFSRSLQESPAGAPMPRAWGDLLVLERLGASDHAEVFRAWDPRLERDVALKLLLAAFDDASLMDEARALARLRHPHVVTVHGIDRRDGRFGLWMELVRGPNLEQAVRGDGPLAPAEALRLGREIGGALAAVHAAGLLHRDIKPANVLRDAGGRFVLADFGLGTRGDARAARPAALSGTPMYMAPELFGGVAPGERSDLYSLGLVLWFALAGRSPFQAATLAELPAVVARGPRPRLRELRPDVPAALAAAIERAIAPVAEERFASVRAFVTALEAVSLPGARAAGPRRGVVVGALAALVLAVAAVALWPRGREAPRQAVVSAPGIGAPATPPPGAYAVEAAFLRRGDGDVVRLASGDRVRPGDRLSLEVRATRRAWFYVLNEDERGERYLLFPQPGYDRANPLGADSTFVLPGPIAGRENAWTVTSAGGREHFLVVASPEPVAELEAELAAFATPAPGRPIRPGAVSERTLDRLRGVGGLAELPADAPAPAPRSPMFERFRALAGREAGVTGVWVRQVTFENPSR